MPTATIVRCCASMRRSPSRPASPQMRKMTGWSWAAVGCGVWCPRCPSSPTTPSCTPPSASFSYHVSATSKLLGTVWVLFIQSIWRDLRLAWRPSLETWWAMCRCPLPEDSRFGSALVRETDRPCSPRPHPPSLPLTPQCSASSTSWVSVFHLILFSEQVRS
ncbi:hypothetical protein GWK47_031503 [Chionoecetes opilio]|uniref:Uncharacterized protein n=1 Tax=Chionoecetes opilio TaxID=41210 RepID=A0A8J5D4T4_CHIOP|nr:hypothetical protein GWK47_031503 [Chionoecetes opilio]